MNLKLRRAYCTGLGERVRPVVCGRRGGPDESRKQVARDLARADQSNKLSNGRSATLLFHAAIVPSRRNAHRGHELPSIPSRPAVGGPRRLEPYRGQRLQRRLGRLHSL